VKIYGLILFLVSLSGCSLPSFSAGQGPKSFVLREQKIEYPKNKLDFRLNVNKTDASRFINSSRIIFSDQPGLRGSYQFANWVDNYPKRFNTILVNQIEASDVFNSVASVSSLTLADYQLNTEIQDVYHDLDSGSEKVILKVSAEVVSSSDRTLIARKTFEVASDEKDLNVEGTVSGYEDVTSEAIKEIILWLSNPEIYK